MSIKYSAVIRIVATVVMAFFFFMTRVPDTAFAGGILFSCRDKTNVGGWIYFTIRDAHQKPYNQVQGPGGNLLYSDYIPWAIPAGADISNPKSFIKQSSRTYSDAVAFNPADFANGSYDVALKDSKGQTLSLSNCSFSIPLDAANQSQQAASQPQAPDILDQIDIGVSNEAKTLDVSSGPLIPCTNKCTFTDIFRLINNLIKFIFKIVLIPVFVILIMYAGFQYLTAAGNASKKADLKKMLRHFLSGLLLMLGSWLIVHTILQLVGYKYNLMFFGS